MKSDILLPLSPKDPRTLSPLIQKIINVHQKNQQKQILAQKANHNMVLQYVKKKNCYSSKRKEKQLEVIKKVAKTRKERIELMNKQSKHVQQILEKFSKLDQQREIVRKQKIKNRNVSSHRNDNQIKQTIFISELTEEQQNTKIKSPRYVSNSLDLQAFYRKNHEKMSMICQQIMRKSIERQNKADQNRKIRLQKNRTKQINQNKLLRKFKADEQYSNKQNKFLRKSINKLELFQRRNQEQHKSQRKKSQQRKQILQKQIQQRTKLREKLQSKIEQSSGKFHKMIIDKQRKVSQNKEQNLQNLIQAKKNKRVKRAQNTQSNFNSNYENFQSRMNCIYKKDREHWGFLTSINQLKDGLIQKNIYQNSQLSLLK